MRVHTAILTACWVVAAVAQSNDGSNLETFPSIITASSTSNTPFNPSTFLSAPGPAIPPSHSSSPTNTSSSLPARTTLISAQPRPSNASSSSLMTAAPNGSVSESVVTSTVDGSVATVTITSSAKPSSGASRRIAGLGAAEGALGVGLAVVLGVAGGVLLV
ncbi:hypothetical protein RTBOTA2_003863 [Rhodotorula toruloides]|nr:hypothetical protein RTBOTA2_003863 [Rhodotorula toruloides]